MKLRIRVERPYGSGDSFTSILADEVTVDVLPGGSIFCEEMGPSVNEDVVFLQAVIEALRSEVVRLEEEVQCHLGRRSEPFSPRRDRHKELSSK